MTYQLVPPDDHRRNISEKAIQFWKDHFVAVLSGASSTFPIRLWYQATPQDEQQLLLLPCFMMTCRFYVVIYAELR